MRPGLAKGYGALNGQAGRQAAVGHLFRLVPFDLVIETGTYRGTTTEFLRGLTAAPIVTIEVVDRLAFYSRGRLKHLPDIRVVLGDSATEIRRTVFRKDRSPGSRSATSTPTGTADCPCAGRCWRCSVRSRSAASSSMTSRSHPTAAIGSTTTVPASA